MFKDKKEERYRVENIDALEFIETIESNSVDLVFIDPPYEISRETGFTNTKLDKYKNHTNDFGEWDYDFDILNQIVKESYRVLKDGGTFICFYDLWKITELKNFMESAKFKQLRFIEWVKTNPVPINSKINYLTNAREIALTGVKKGKPTFNSKYDNGIYSYPIYKSKDRFHPTQKSVKLYEDIVLKHTNEGDLILDCFLGSGTTVVAGLNTERKVIGTEINKEYYDKILKRVEGCI